MSPFGTRYVLGLTFVAALALGACSSRGPVDTTIASIKFQTQSLPPGGAGQLYDQTIVFETTGGAALPDRFQVLSGALPPGIQLLPEHVNNDPSAALTGNAVLIGYARTPGSYTFTLRGISTPPAGSNQPALSADQAFTVNIGAGRVNILTPTAAQGTTDPAVPAFPDVIDFVNPTNPQAFFDFAFQVAGGSGNNLLNVYVPRELELSVFDQAVVNNLTGLNHDLDESALSGNKLDPYFSDGGWFVLQAGMTKVQVGGFQSPRGPVGTLTEYGDFASPQPGLDPAWFQVAPGAGGPAQNSRRDFGDSDNLSGGDTLLIPGRTIQFSDYFDASYEGTNPGFTDPDPTTPPDLVRRKYPFTADQYHDAFFLSYDAATDITPLRYYIIAEAIDRNNTPTKTDDVIARKAYVVQVRIPDIKIDTVNLPDGQAGVDYTPFVNASGGVPPLQYELEGIDGTPDQAITAGDPLTKDDFGLDLNNSTGQFFGVPRASGVVDVTVRVYASVMNPTQNGDAYVPTPNPGEFNGKNPVTGEKGIHKTFPVNFAPPTMPVVMNSTLTPGVDGATYPGDTIRGSGGVPRLLPYPVGYTGTYPSGTAKRNYTLSASYIRDASYGVDAGTVDPTRQLPKSLTLDGDPLSATDGQISGVPTDRGFHPVTFDITDFYLGTATAPDTTAHQQMTQKTLALSISPDTVLYMRGATSTEDAGGTPSGLIDSTSQQGEARMVPMFLSAALFTVQTGKSPVIHNGAVTATADLLPVMLANGGQDENVDKGIPSISGYWPAESNQEGNDGYYYEDRAWRHEQQQNCWIQTTLPSQNRVMLWGDTLIKQWSSGASGGWGKRYQQMDTNGKRGVLVLNPLTGDFWVPAILTNSSSDDGSQFGAECVMGQDDSYGDGFNVGIGYWKQYYYPYEDSRWDREVLGQGLGSYLEDESNYNTGTGWYKSAQGRSGISVAVSADSVWAATALPGGSNSKILLWRNDKQPIPTNILSQPYVRSLTGKDASGADMPNSAVVIDVGGNNASGYTMPSGQQYLLPDSLEFVDGGLLFLMQGAMDHVFGMSLYDATFTSHSVSGSGPAVSSVAGQFVPDEDYLRLQIASALFSAQFAFAGDQPPSGSTGPDKLAFVAGQYSRFTQYTDLGAQPRDGYLLQGNAAKSLFFLSLAKDGNGGLDLGSSSLSDLTGSDSRVYGDLLTPGRLGEEQDWLSLSPDGKYAAVVREFSTSSYSGFYYYQPASFASNDYDNYWGDSGDHDIMLLSTDGSDLDSGATGTQTVLYLGTATSVDGGGSPTMPSYATAKAYLNAGRRRINGVVFGDETGTGSRSLVFNYSGDPYYDPNYNGANGPGWGINPTQTGTFGFGVQQSIRFQFRTSTGDAINFSSGTASSFLSNNLTGLKNINGIGSGTPNFGGTTGNSDQMFWSTFKSQNGEFLYYVSDQLTGRNFMVGFNTSESTINGHDPYVPFSPHATTVGLEQIDANAWNYSNRFVAVPGGVASPTDNKDGAGIICFVASDASAGATSSTDLDVYAFDANIGGDAHVLTSDVTDGTANAINYLYLSADGNVLVGQRCKTTSNSRSSRSVLESTNDLFVVTNVHQVLAGGTPNDFVISAGASNGASVAFVGEGTPVGPQAIVFSTTTGGGSWDTRTLKVARLIPNATVDTIDSTQSYYEVLAGGRVIDDNPDTSN